MARKTGQIIRRGIQHLAGPHLRRPRSGNPEVWGHLSEMPVLRPGGLDL